MFVGTRLERSRARPILNNGTFLIPQVLCSKLPVSEHMFLLNHKVIILDPRGAQSCNETRVF